ncbi:hypothetical protein GGF31_005539 [Allomyces arbusculus]|nr:hypothetical protein GGF31_005539 [Allomyces arbusculus]
MELGLAPSRSASSQLADHGGEPSRDTESDLVGTPAADTDPAAVAASRSTVSEDERATFVMRFRDGFPTQVFPSPGVVEPKAALIANLEDASVLLGRPPGDELLTRLNEAHATRLLDAAKSDPNHAHLFHIVASAFVLSQDELAAKVQGLSSADVQLLRDAVEAVYQLSTDASTVTARHVLGRQLQRAHIATLPPAMQQALVGVPRTDTQLLAPSKDPAIALLNPLRLPKASINKVATIMAKAEQDGVGSATEADKRSINTPNEDTRGASARGRKRGGRVAVIEGVQPPPPGTTRAPLNPHESVAPTPGFALDASYSRLYSWFAQSVMAPTATGAPPPPIRSVTAASSAAAVPGPLGFASGRVIPPPPPPPPAAPLAASAPPAPPADPAVWTGSHRPPISTSYSSYALAQAWQASAVVTYVPFPPPPLVPPSLFAPPSSTPPPPPTPAFPFHTPVGAAGPVPASIFAEFGRTATPPLPVHQLPPQLPAHPALVSVAPASMGGVMVGTDPIAAQPAPTDGTLRPPLPQHRPIDQPLNHRVVAPQLVTAAGGPAEPTAAVAALSVAPPPPPPAQPQSIPTESGPVGDAVPPPSTSPPPAASRRRGRPPKRRAETADSGTLSAAQPGLSVEASSSTAQDQGAQPAAPKRRGRPPKRRTVTSPPDMPTTGAIGPIAAGASDAGPQPALPAQAAPAPKRRGRPPKRRAEPTPADTATNVAKLIATDSTAAAVPSAPFEQPQSVAPAPKRRGRPPKRAASLMALDEAAANVPESTPAAQEDTTSADRAPPVSLPGVRWSARVRRRSEQLVAATSIDGVQPRTEASAADELVASPSKRRRRASTVRDHSATDEHDRSTQSANPNMAGADGVVPSPQVESRLSLSDLLGCPASTAPLLPPCALVGAVDPSLAAHSARPLGVVPPPLTPLAMVSRPPTVVNSPAIGHDQTGRASPGVGFTGVPAPRRFDSMSLGGEGSQNANVDGIGAPTTLAALLGVMGPVALTTSEST